jgi:class 3 adenylate cyclase
MKALDRSPWSPEPGRLEPAKHGAQGNTCATALARSPSSSCRTSGRCPGSSRSAAAPEGRAIVIDLLPKAPVFSSRALIESRRRMVESDRVQATVLFTDLVGSTAKALELGPRWSELLREHNARIRRELARHSGRAIDTSGDGFFASGFAGPAHAIRCACAIRDRVTEIGLQIRVGIHIGECEVIDGKLGGLTVVIGARVAAHADGGEVLVSGTVRDLVAGSDIDFEPRGMRELKGLGAWPLYAVASA